MTESEIAVQIIGSLFILSWALFALWRIAEGERRYWKRQAQRYQQMLDQAAWNPDGTEADNQSTGQPEGS